MRPARTWRNIAVLPVVLLVRMPLLLVLLALVRVGAAAEATGEFLGCWLPGLDDEDDAKRRATRKQQRGQP